MRGHSKKIGGMLLICSPDDEGWYWQRMKGDWETSQIFSKREQAISAWEDEELTWEGAE